MTQDELQKIIDQIEADDLLAQGTFGIFNYEGDPDSSIIRANKEGLALFALELLKAAKNAEDAVAGNGQNVIQFNPDDAWIDKGSDTFIRYFAPIGVEQEKLTKADHKSTIADKLTSFGCILIAILLVVSAVVGIVTLGKWFF